MRNTSESLNMPCFNIISTSVDAWVAFLRANRDLDLKGRGGNVRSPNSEHTPFAKFAELLADVLKSIGSSITARSDTFRITSYGQREDPISGSVITAKCAVLIQRYQEYIASAENEPEDEVSDSIISNEAFGRRYKIIDFRWLN